MDESTEPNPLSRWRHGTRWRTASPRPAGAPIGQCRKPVIEEPGQSPSDDVFLDKATEGAGPNDHSPSALGRPAQVAEKLHFALSGWRTSSGGVVLTSLYRSHSPLLSSGLLTWKR
jgi:hypothetical protein